METRDYDTEVLLAIGAGHQTNADLRVELGFPADRYERRIDTALQRLRKRGHIVAQGGRWHLADRKPCPHCKGTGFAREGA